MLRDQGLFSQVISWDSHYTDFYSLSGAQEEWCPARSRLQSHSKEFGLLEIIRNIPRNSKLPNMIWASLVNWACCRHNAFTSNLFSHQVRTYQVNLMMIIRTRSPMDDKLHQLHKDKSIFNAHWGDNINAPVKAKMRKFSRITKYSSKNSITVNKNS